MSLGGYPSPQDWLRGWREWARTRKRGRMAQFIVDKLEEGKQAQWLDISKGMFELTEWHAIAKEWFGEKPRNSEQVDAPCMLRKGLPRAFPGLEELKDQSRKEGTQYRSRVFQAPLALVQEVVLHITNRPPPSHQLMYTPPTQEPNHSSYPGYPNLANGVPTSGTSGHSHYYQGMPLQYNGSATPAIKLEANSMSMDYSDHPLHAVPSSSYLAQNDSEFLEVAAQVIAGSGAVVDPTAYSAAPVTSSANGWFNTSPHTVPPATGTMLGVPLSPTSSTVYPVDDVSRSLMGSPAPPYSLSPSNSPSYSQPGSVPDPQHSQPLSAELSPATHASGSPALLTAPIDEQEPSMELLNVKAVPNQSSLEGGGAVALVFYQALPVGLKYISFASRTNRTLVYTQQACVENPLVLTTSIPKYPLAEEVDLRVFTAEGLLIATTPFTYYELQQHNSDIMLQLLSQHLQSYFPPVLGQGTGGAGMASGAQGGGAGYSGGYQVPNSAYQLLLGACRLGCEPLVACLLSLPAMAAITNDELQKACDIATDYGHQQLADVLMLMVTMHSMSPGLVSRDGGGAERKDGEPQHVKEYYTAKDKLAKGGRTPEEQATTVMQQLLRAIEESKKADEKQGPTVASVPASNEADQSDHSVVEELTQQMEGTTISSTGSSRRSSYLHRQPQSISDDDEISAVTPAEGDTFLASRPSLSEQNDTVAPLPDDEEELVVRRKHTFAQAISDADSAIGMSFEDDSQSLLLEVQRRKSSSLVPADFVSASRDSPDKAITIKLPPDAGVEVANSLSWKTAFIVSEDFPPSAEHKIFCRGDQIIQIGDKNVSGLSRDEFSELFESETRQGTTVKIVPEVDRVPEGKEAKLLRRTPSEQTLFDSITRRVNNLLTVKPSSNSRSVTIPHTSSGFGVKMIGGKSVGVFISDVRSDLTAVSPGDQVLEINCHRTHGLTLYQATQLLRMSSSDLHLSVVENKAKFQSVREHFELDSFYLRSRVDLPAQTFRDMTLKKGVLLHVVNTFIHAPNHWLAWAVNEQTGMETHLRRIPSPAMAKRQCKCEAYDSVEKSTGMFPRPVCVIGPDSAGVAGALAKNKQFQFCCNIDEALRVFAQGSYHATMSISELAELKQLTALHPIILQTQASVGAPLMQQIKFSKLNVAGFLAGEGTSQLAEHAVQQVAELQHQPIWRTAGVLC